MHADMRMVVCICFYMCECYNICSHLMHWNWFRQSKVNLNTSNYFYMHIRKLYECTIKYTLSAAKITLIGGKIANFFNTLVQNIATE